MMDFWNYYNFLIQKCYLLYHFDDSHHSHQLIIMTYNLNNLLK